ncbi:MAG: HAD-IA family hydrolase [Synechococcaceae cyanobacterium]|nr:HAD-IA family hydrolase [Synechococcaceae cyanobacterium]
MAPPAACLFDLDGLLLDTEPLHARAWQAAAARFGLDLQPAALVQLRGRRRLDCAQIVLGWIQDAGFSCPDTEALLAIRQPIAEHLMALAPAIDGAEALVRRCHNQGVPMALATSSGKAAVALKAAPHAWLQLITIRVHGDDPELRAGKPAPDVFELAAARVGVAPQACWAFEDSLAGAFAAHAAGCRVHVLNTPGIDPTVLPQGAVLIDSLRAVDF